MIEDKHLAAALLERRKKVAEKINRLKKQIAQLEANLVHIDSTIMLLDSEAAPKDQIKRQYRRTLYFAHGEQARRILTALRQANGEPVSTKSITIEMMKEKGLDPEDSWVREDLRKRIYGAMYSLSSQGLVKRIGPLRTGKWVLVLPTEDGE